MFVFAAALMAILAIALHRALPVVPARAASGYAALLRSVFTIARRERLLQVTMTYGMTGLATFTIFWTALTFLLSGPLHYSDTVIGSFGTCTPITQCDIAGS